MIELRGVSKSVPSGSSTLTILHPIDLVVPNGQVVAITGASGSGKSTLLGLIAGLDAPTSGQIAIDGVDTPVGPGSTIAAVAVADSIKVRTAQLLAARGVLPPTITRASVVGAERSRALFDAAYQEHARRIARVIGGEAR